MPNPFLGKTILVFGDSHSDGAGTPGNRLGALLLGAGAGQVYYDAKSGRSARSYFTLEDGAARLVEAQKLRPDLVVVILGSNAIGKNLELERQALLRIAQAFEGIGAEVWAIGPPYWPPDIMPCVDATKLDAGAEKVISMMAELFGAHFLDARTMTADIPASGRAKISVGECAGSPGIHFAGIGAQTWANRMFQTLAGAMVQVVLAPEAPAEGDGASRKAIGVGLIVAGVVALFAATALLVSADAFEAEARRRRELSPR